MSGGIVSFGSYTFSLLQDYSDNFADGVPKTKRMPGLDGGWNDDGDSPSQSQIGRVTVGFYLQAATRSGMDALRDAVSAMYDYGLAKLVYQPTNSGDSQRYTWARVNFIRMSERKQDHTDLLQKVQVIFQVPDPHWYVDAHWPLTLGDGTNLGDAGKTIGSGAETIAASGVTTMQTINNAGNASVIVPIAIIPGAGNSCENPRVRRTVDGAVVDSFNYVGTVGATDELLLDGNRQIAQLNGANIFGASLGYEHPDFMRLEAGNNSIEVKFKNAGDTATIHFWIRDTWR